MNIFFIIFLISLALAVVIILIINAIIINRNKPEAKDSITEFQCNYCNLKFSFKDKLEEHIVLKHLFKCNCGKKFYWNENGWNNLRILAHVKICKLSSEHSNITFQCNICNLKFTSKDESKAKDAVEKHISSEHSNITFQCNICNLKFTSKDESKAKDAVEKHISLEHLFKCNYCEEKFYSEKDLKSHLWFFKRKYEILGIKENSTQDEIKRAYHNLAKKKHPDITKNPNDAEEFKKILEAYEFLMNNKNNKH